MHLPADLGVEGRDDRRRGRLRLLDAFGGASRLGNELLRLEHHGIPQSVLIGIPWQPNHAMHLPCTSPLVVHSGLHDFGRWKPDPRPPGFVVFIKDLRTAQVHADQHVAADQPGTAAVLALANQHVGDRSASSDQVGKTFEPLDRGPLALDGDRRGRRLEAGQGECHGNHEGC